jgi:hypothetical protein
MTVGPGTYRELALAEAWRLASLVDRNPHSPTRGSFSRTHWGWKFEDFPFPRMQEGVYALCRLHDLDDDRNPLRGSADVAQWIAWGFEYWASRQHASGAFDEAYPNEQCLAATAFTAFYLGSAYLLWKERLPQALRERLEGAFGRAGAWLCANDETHGILSNHLAAAVAALAVVERITGNARHGERARFFLERILAHQSAEGWMREYDAADIGYGTHGFFYLAVYWRMTGCERTFAALTRFAGFLRHFCHPDGTVGGEYSSRNTEFFFPAGFEILAERCPHSRSVAAAMRGPLAERRTCGLWAMDAFNFMPLLNNLLFAADAARELDGADPLPWQGEPFVRVFPDAGLWVVNDPAFYAVVGLGKGGTACVFDKGARRLAARHAGYFAKWRGATCTSQDCVPRPEVRWLAQGRSAELDVPWRTVSHRVFTPALFLGFRLFTLTLGRFPAVSRWVKDLLVAVLIRRKRRPPIAHRRRIDVTDRGLAISDEIRFPPGVDSVTEAAQFTAIHMGSSMYCDVRAVHGSAATREIAVEPGARTRIRGTLSLGGASWSRTGD